MKRTVPLVTRTPTLTFDPEVYADALVEEICDEVRSLRHRAYYIKRLECVLNSVEIAKRYKENRSFRFPEQGNPGQ